MSFFKKRKKKDECSHFWHKVYSSSYSSNYTLYCPKCKEEKEISYTNYIKMMESQKIDSEYSKYLEQKNKLKETVDWSDF